MTKVRTKETISIEKTLVLGKWLSSLNMSISSMLMISLSRECIISLFYRFSPVTFFFTPLGKLIVILCFCRFVVVIGFRFDKFDRLFVSWLTTT
jgi:1,4-dihydroxy-2-naphthoate octaprenyltransferase